MSPVHAMFLAALIGRAAPAEPPPPKKTSLVEEKDLSVRLSVLPKASLADAGLFCVMTVHSYRNPQR